MWQNWHSNIPYFPSTLQHIIHSCRNTQSSTHSLRYLLHYFLPLVLPFCRTAITVMLTISLIFRPYKDKAYPLLVHITYTAPEHCRPLAHATQNITTYIFPFTHKLLLTVICFQHPPDKRQALHCKVAISSIISESYKSLTSFTSNETGLPSSTLPTHRAVCIAYNGIII